VIETDKDYFCLSSLTPILKSNKTHTYMFKEAAIHNPQDTVGDIVHAKFFQFNGPK